MLIEITSGNQRSMAPVSVVLRENTSSPWNFLRMFRIAPRFRLMPCTKKHAKLFSQQQAKPAAWVTGVVAAVENSLRRDNRKMHIAPTKRLRKGDFHWLVVVWRQTKSCQWMIMSEPFRFWPMQVCPDYLCRILHVVYCVYVSVALYFYVFVTMDMCL